MLIVSHLHVNNTCGCEVRAHRRVCLGRLPQGAGLQGHSHSLSTFLGPHVAPCITVLSCVIWDQTALLIVHIEQRKCPFPPHVSLKGF